MTVGGIAQQSRTQNPAYKPTHGFFQQPTMETWSYRSQHLILTASKAPFTAAGFISKGSVAIAINVPQ